MDKSEVASIPTVTVDTNPVVPVSSSMASSVACDSLLMTCRVHIEAPDGSVVEARALLDSASSASFISDRLASSLSLPRSNRMVSISGIAGLSHHTQNHATALFTVRSATKSFEVAAIVVPRVTRDLPFHPVPFSSSWTHLLDLPLADPNFGQPGRIDILFGVDVYVEVLLRGRQTGAPDAPVAFETEFGWVLAGTTGQSSSQPATTLTTLHVAHQATDDLIRKFWETEETPSSITSLTPEEKFFVDHFKANHSRDETGRFTVPLPHKISPPILGES